VERDGMLLMVDDDRFPLKPGEVPVERSIRFRTLGCYPLTGAVESEARRCRSDSGNAVDHHLRTPGPRIDKDGGDASHGEEEAGGLFLTRHGMRSVPKRQPQRRLGGQARAYPQEDPALWDDEVGDTDND
jgi:3'-phosphoadenosine 5'-phosphosulfate sulfotransferase (PAPS reductase)/FAD synthetase